MICRFASASLAAHQVTNLEETLSSVGARLAGDRVTVLAELDGQKRALLERRGDVSAAALPCAHACLPRAA